MLCFPEYTRDHVQLSACLALHDVSEIAHIIPGVYTQHILLAKTSLFTKFSY